jgi:hypothetical protein
MALSLGVSVGSWIFVGAPQKKLVVTGVEPGVSIAIQYDGREYKITDRERTKIDECVFLSYGKSPRPGAGSVRLAFEAPKNIPIVRSR